MSNLGGEIGSKTLFPSSREGIPSGPDGMDSGGKNALPEGLNSGTETGGNPPPGATASLGAVNGGKTNIKIKRSPRPATATTIKNLGELSIL
ncbi:MAG: hypothetical protein AAB897_03595 [Patescibacteria group bacterium]